ncbi:MAG: histidine phosphatase family protein [Lentisphaerae bacterium]|nr:histidine phosphatase family protein [Lentisphaerota bacterium]
MDLNAPVREEQPLVIVFVRHGEPEPHVPNHEKGPGLTPLGKQQARRVAKRFAKETFDHIYISDLTRARETAEIIRQFHRHTPFTISQDLREITHHHFIPDPLQKQEKSDLIRTERDTIERFVKHLRETYLLGQKVLVVCHGNVIRSMLPLLGGRDPRNMMLIDINHTAVTIVEVWKSGEAVLKLGNCVKHLLPNQIT